jgi:hypothetical protein
VTTTPTPRVEPRQEYERHDPRDNSTTRIRIKSRPRPGWLGDTTVDIVTVTPDGRELRPRPITVRQLHPADWTGRAGYRLVRNADGTPAGGEQQ